MDAVTSTLRQSLKRLSFRRSSKSSRGSRMSLARRDKPKEDDLSNRLVTFKGVPVSYIASLAAGVVAEEVGPDIKLVVLTEDVSGVSSSGRTLHVVEELGSGDLRARASGEDKLVTIPARVAREKRRREWTIEDVFEFVLLEEARDDLVPVVDIIERKGGHALGGPLQGCYLVCPRDTRLVVLADALVAECRRKHKRTDEQFVWMDIFGVNFARILDQGEDKRGLLDVLVKAMARFDSRWVLLESWEDPHVLTRFWCAWEIHHMLATGFSLPTMVPRARRGEAAGKISGLSTSPISEPQNEPDAAVDSDSASTLFEEDAEVLLDKGRVDAILRTVQNQDLACGKREDYALLKGHTSRSAIQKSVREQSQTWLVQSTILSLSRLRPNKSGLELADLVAQAGDLLLFILKDQADQLPKQQKHQQHFHTAIKYYTEALGVYSRKKKDVQAAAMVSKMGTVYEDLREYDLALSKYKKAFFIHKARNDPAMVAKTLSKIANVWALKGKYDKALEKYEQACLLLILIKDKDPLLVADTIVNTANVLAYQRKYEQALKKYEQAILIRREKLGNFDPAVADVLNSMANVMASQSRLDDALDLYQQALDIYERAYGEQHLTVFVTLNNIAVILNDQDQSDQALEILNQALALVSPAAAASASSPSARASHRSSLTGATTPNTSNRQSVGSSISAVSANVRTLDAIPDIATTYNNMAVCLEAQKKYAKAMEKYNQALSIYQEQLGPNHPKVANILLNIGVSLLESQGKPEEAAGRFRQALAIYQAAYGDHHPDTKECKAMLARASSV